MNPTNTNPPIPLESDDEVDNADLPSGRLWAYPCKLPSCPDYGKSWMLRSNFLFHLHEQEAHTETASTPVARRITEIEWRYITTLHLPPRATPDFRSRGDSEEQIWIYNIRDTAGKMITRKGTLKQMEADITTQRRQLEEK
jgi:hypothetical protein